MPDYALCLTNPEQVPEGEVEHSFYWHPGDGSSFTTQLTPTLASLGPVAPLNIDLVRIAVAAFAADRSTKRQFGGANWNERTIGIDVPVSDPAAWSGVAGRLAQTLRFLSGDSWSVTFRADEAAPEDPRESAIVPDRVVLLSGGADSAIGALVARDELSEGERVAFVSHVGGTTISPTQRGVAETVLRLMPGPAQHHFQLQLSRSAKRRDGTSFQNEYTSRSRSFLFLSLGLAVASGSGVPLWIPENGFASLNPPLGPDRRGSLSTRTTHPAFLAELSSLLAQVGAHNDIANPFASHTKGEMFTRAAGLVGNTEASAFLSATNSCAHSGQRGLGISPTTACGVCFGCFVRRASFRAAGLADTTLYIAPQNAQHRRWLASKSVEPAMRAFVERGVSSRDVLAMSLPADYPISDALDLCARGIVELGGLL